MPTTAFLTDSTLCIGCKACEVACSACGLREARAQRAAERMRAGVGPREP